MENIKIIIIGLTIVLISVFAVTFYYVAFIVLFILLSLLIGKAVIIAEKESNKIN